MVLCNVYAVYIKIMNNENQTIHKFDFNLNWYGWNDKLSQLKQESLYSTLPHGRISIVHRTCYEVVSENGLFQCELTGNMMYGKSDAELPCTGDWVLFQPFDENKGIIVYMLPRERTLYRKKSGTVADKQAIASYVDKAFIVQSLDDNFNVRRVERFMVQVLEENIKPVLVLNKSDLDFDRQSVEEQINHISNQIPVFFTSIHQPQTILRLRESISEGNGNEYKLQAILSLQFGNQLDTYKLGYQITCYLNDSNQYFIIKAECFYPVKSSSCERFAQCINQ